MRKTKLDYLRELNANPDDKRHGTTTGYGYGCRCDACREAWSDKNKQYRHNCF